MSSNEVEYIKHMLKILLLSCVFNKKRSIMTEKTQAKYELENHTMSHVEIKILRKRRIYSFQNIYGLISCSLSDI